MPWIYLLSTLSIFLVDQEAASPDCAPMSREPLDLDRTCPCPSCPAVQGCLPPPPPPPPPPPASPLSALFMLMRASAAHAQSLSVCQKSVSRESLATQERKKHFPVCRMDSAARVQGTAGSGASLIRLVLAALGWWWLAPSSRETTLLAGKARNKKAAGALRVLCSYVLHGNPHLPLPSSLPPPVPPAESLSTESAN
jgi:hypothetical protein